MINSFLGFCQNEEDALRFSQSTIHGSARNVSMAGALTALGGDYSTTFQNPASLARMSKSHFVFTPSVELISNHGNFYGNKTNNQITKLTVGNMSVMKTLYLDPDKHGKWSTVQIGCGYSKITTFNDEKQYTGELDSSIIHHFINEANGTSVNAIYNRFPFTSSLAYDVYAIDPIGGNQYGTELKSGNTIHNRIVRTNGQMGEFNGVISANYNDKLYIGGSFSAINNRFYTSFSHRENYTDADIIWLNSTEYTGYLSIKGWGFNGRIGAIYLPKDNLRFGLSFQTPTIFKMNDQWGNDMTANTDDSFAPIKTVASQYKPVGNYQYNIKTPLKTNLSFGAIIRKKIALGMDFEIINHSFARLSDQKMSSYPYSFDFENNEIKSVFRTVVNCKIGMEARITEKNYLRLGYAFFPSPYKPGINDSFKDYQFITGGVGYNKGDFFLDLSLMTRFHQLNYYAYNSNLKGSTSTFNQNQFIFSVSVGFRFENRLYSK